ncbi:MAG: hypothetical protein M1834_001510 [Cirrosporium novae-zelandiae]|nr:MAG: hypothetical protein M1834_004027 [Cirrosporium novae-zelandiae]KAI9735495.1 MAG: hypothetical protein M1834_001510 [Cirrosporium novae-zelandiae]
MGIHNVLQNLGYSSENAANRKRSRKTIGSPTDLQHISLPISNSRSSGTDSQSDQKRSLSLNTETPPSILSSTDSRTPVSERRVHFPPSPSSNRQSLLSKLGYSSEGAANRKKHSSQNSLPMRYPPPGQPHSPLEPGPVSYNITTIEDSPEDETQGVYDDEPSTSGATSFQTGRSHLSAHETYDRPMVKPGNLFERPVDRKGKLPVMFSQPQPPRLEIPPNPPEYSEYTPVSPTDSLSVPMGKPQKSNRDSLMMKLGYSSAGAANRKSISATSPPSVQLPPDQQIPTSIPPTISENSRVSPVDIASSQGRKSNQSSARGRESLLQKLGYSSEGAANRKRHSMTNLSTSSQPPLSPLKPPNPPFKSSNASKSVPVSPVDNAPERSGRLSSTSARNRESVLQKLGYSAQGAANRKQASMSNLPSTGNSLLEPPNPSLRSSKLSDSVPITPTDDASVYSRPYSTTSSRNRESLLMKLGYSSEGAANRKKNRSEIPPSPARSQVSQPNIRSEPSTAAENVVSGGLGVSPDPETTQMAVQTQPGPSHSSAPNRHSLLSKVGYSSDGAANRKRRNSESISRPMQPSSSPRGQQNTISRPESTLGSVSSGSGSIPPVPPIPLKHHKDLHDSLVEPPFDSEGSIPSSASNQNSNHVDLMVAADSVRSIGSASENNLRFSYLPGDDQLNVGVAVKKPTEGYQTLPPIKTTDLSDLYTGTSDTHEETPADRNTRNGGGRTYEEMVADHNSRGRQYIRASMVSSNYDEDRDTPTSTATDLSNDWKRDVSPYLSDTWTSPENSTGGPTTKPDLLDDLIFSISGNAVSRPTRKQEPRAEANGHVSKDNSDGLRRQRERELESARFSERTKPALRHVIDLNDIIDTEMDPPAVIRVTIQKEIHHTQERRTSHETNTQDIYRRVLPVVDLRVLPAKHFISGVNGELVEIDEKDVPTLNSKKWPITEAPATVPEKRSGRSSAGQFAETDRDPKRYAPPSGHERADQAWAYPPNSMTGGRDMQKRPFNFQENNPGWTLQQTHF